MNIAEEIFRRANTDAVALITSHGGQVTYGELEQRTRMGAESLGALTGRRIGLHLPNGVDHVLWSLSVLRAGGVLIPVAPELTAPERRQLAQTTALHAVLTRAGQAWDDAARSETAKAGEFTALLHELPPSAQAAEFDEGALLALNPALVRFSSGTTGKRKGIVLSHETLMARVTAANSGLQIGPGDRVIWMLPMAHHFAVSIMLYLLHGAATVLLVSHLGADIHKALHEHDGTVIYAAPFHYALLVAVPELRRSRSLRLAVSTTAALPEATADAFERAFGLPLRQALGIIECGLPLQNTRWPEKRGSVGAPQGGFEAELRGVQGGNGELWLRGPGMVDAYLSPWTPREAVLADGWLKTGDQARRDADGAFFLEGRTHSVINVGGMKCFPEEVEACLQEHAAVKEARVSAVAHAQFGAVPAAEVVVREGREKPKLAELMGHCRQRLSGYKVPMKWVFVESLPRTPSGKIDRVAPLRG